MYKYYIPVFRKYFVSTDSTFFESISYSTFTSTNQLAPSRRLPLHVSTTKIKQISVPRTRVETMPYKKLLLAFSHREKVSPPNSLHITPTSLGTGPQHLQPSSAPISALFIPLRKGKRSTISHHISQFISYDKLNLLFHQLHFLFPPFLYSGHLRKHY